MLLSAAERALERRRGQHGENGFTCPPFRSIRSQKCGVPGGIVLDKPQRIRVGVIQHNLKGAGTVFPYLMRFQRGTPSGGVDTNLSCRQIARNQNPWLTPFTLRPACLRQSGKCTPHPATVEAAKRRSTRPGDYGAGYSRVKRSMQAPTALRHQSTCFWEGWRMIPRQASSRLRAWRGTVLPPASRRAISRLRRSM